MFKGSNNESYSGSALQEAAPCEICVIPMTSNIEARHNNKAGRTAPLACVLGAIGLRSL